MKGPHEEPHSSLKHVGVHSRGNKEIWAWFRRPGEKHLEGQTRQQPYQPAELPQLDLLLEVLDVVLSGGLAILLIAGDLVFGDVFLFPDLAADFLLASFLVLWNEALLVSLNIGLREKSLLHFCDVDKKATLRPDRILE